MVKNSSGTINSNTMTSFLNPKNPNPNIISTYNNFCCFFEYMEKGKGGSIFRPGAQTSVHN